MRSILLLMAFTPLIAVAIELNGYFKNSFEESDQAFEQSLVTIKKLAPAAEKFEFNFDQGTIKSVYWPASKKSDKLLIVISGTHGVEAFVGSAVQRWMIDQDFIQKRESTNILFVHGLNVYGFKNKRRVNEKNIDLNRNFISDRAKFTSDDEGYKNLNDFLNPTVNAEYGVWAKIKFVTSAVLKILRYGLENLRNPILRGQYSFPEGIFYGGRENAKQGELLSQLIDKYIVGKNKIFVVDLHTGYGARGKLHLLADGKKEGHPLLQVFSEDKEIDFGSDKSFYTVQGELLHYFTHKIVNHNKLDVSQVLGITFEYGTLDSQKTKGSIESLRRMVVENQNFWHPATDPQDAEKIKNDFVEMFNPSDSEWRKAIIEQTEIKTRKILAWLEK